jgi:hypothetical protein
MKTKYVCVSDNSDKKMHEIVFTKRLFMCYNTDIFRSYLCVSLACFRKQKQAVMFTVQCRRAQYLQFFKIIEIIYTRVMFKH